MLLPHFYIRIQVLIHILHKLYRQKQIDRDTAEQLQRQLDTGYTGDGLEFDALYYPYYAMLNDKDRLEGQNGERNNRIRAIIIASNPERFRCYFFAQTQASLYIKWMTGIWGFRTFQMPYPNEMINN